jgi:hypothetical protein
VRQLFSLFQYTYGFLLRCKVLLRERVVRQAVSVAMKSSRTKYSFFFVAKNISRAKISAVVFDMRKADQKSSR